MLRVIIALGQNRGRLRNAYNALRGRDPRTGVVVPESRARELALIQDAQAHALNSTNWDDFLRVLGRAGFRSKKMITSDNTVLYTYALWLIGHTRFKVDRTTLRDVMARWFFMSQTTGRYTNSPETRIEEDLSRFAEASNGDATAFVGILNQVIDTVLTSDFWSIRLPDDFITSSTSASPAYQGYLAALNILDANLFSLHGKVREWMDPSAGTMKDVEGHHLFPRAYLDRLGVKGIKKINQVANFAPTDWSTNLLISDRPPTEYWPELVSSRSLKGDTLKNQMFWHALPEGWENLEYDDFLNKRRFLMARVVRDGYMKLCDPEYLPNLEQVTLVSEEATSINVTLAELVASGLIKVGDLLSPADTEKDSLAEIIEGGLLHLGEHSFDSLRRAAKADGDEHTDGWDYWILNDESPRTMREIAEMYLATLSS
jgi:hypothetical protein